MSEDSLHTPIVATHFELVGIVEGPKQKWLVQPEIIHPLAKKYKPLQ
jgi:hypothetical protein